MKKFEVTITETLKKKVEVEAETWEEAEQIVSDDWYKGEHILDADNFTEVNFNAKEYDISSFFSKDIYIGIKKNIITDINIANTLCKLSSIF